MKEKVSTSLCKKRLALLWFVGGIAIFLLLVIQSIGGIYGERVEEVWSWFLPTIMPTLSLMIGVFVLDMVSGRSSEKKVDRFFFRLVLGLSAIYLILVAIIIISQPLIGGVSQLLELMKRSHLWLGPFQGLTTAALGAFFVKGEQRSEESDGGI